MQESKQEKSQIKRNIMQYLQVKSITPYEFYKKTGVTRGVLTQNNGITEDNLARFLAYAPDVNIEWLLTGNGPMLRADERDGGNNKKDEVGATDERSTSDIPIATPATTPGEGIPLLPIDAMAGALTSEQTVLEYECERYVVPIFNGADFLIPVSGNSMTPTYYPGDIVACKRVPLSGLFFQWGKIYVIDTSQGPLIKRIKPGQSPEQLCIVSDNSDYYPFQLPITDIRAVALVIGVIRLE